jgi:exosortase/archaeosortase family protein
MVTRLNYMWALLVLQMGAFYPVWLWYTRRIGDISDEPWGLLALAACAAFAVLDRPSKKAQCDRLALPAALTLVYAFTFPFAPHLARACMAVTAIGCTIGILRYGSAFHMPMWGLLILSLPVIPSLQFYLGYPLRVCSGAITAPLLQLSGFAVVQEGSCLRYGAELLAIDAPCSGVHMLWTGLFLTFSMAWYRRLNNWKTIMFAAFTVLAIIPANALRAASLFFVESAQRQLPPWCHEIVGLTVFAMLAVGLLCLCRHLKGDVPCEA